jgi:hypothetical protein
LPVTPIQPNTVTYCDAPARSAAAQLRR